MSDEGDGPTPSHGDDGLPGLNGNGNGNGAGGKSDEDRRERTTQAILDAADRHNGATPHVQQEGSLRPRHPETPYTTLPDNVPMLFAEEIGDPIAKNVITAMLGKAAWAMPEDKAFGTEKGIEPGAQAVADVRKGAYEIQSAREGQPDRELIASTTHDIAQLRVDGDADAQKAQRVADSIPRIVEKRQTALEERDIAQQQRDAAFEHRARVREQEDERVRALEDGVNEAKRSDRKIARWLRLRKRVPVLGKAAPPVLIVWAVMVIDMVCTALNLQPAIANGINIDPTLAYALAGGVSVGVLMAAAVAGVMLAASRIPPRVAALALVALFVAVMTVFLPGLELMREGEPEGLKSLTTATALAAYVAFVVAYAHTVFRDSGDERKITAEQDDVDERDRELLQRAGSPLHDACDELDGAEEKLADAITKFEALDAELEGAYAQVEALLDSHERVEARVAGREGNAERAEVRGSVREEVLVVQRRQEDRSVAHAVNAAWLFYWTTRSEKLDPEQAAGTPPVGAPADRHEPSAAERMAVKVAIASLVAAGVLGLLLGPVAFAVGAAVAAVALVVTLLRRRPTGDNAASAGVTNAAPSDRIGGLVTTDDPTFSQMPSYTVPRYRSVDADPTEAQ